LLDKKASILRLSEENAFLQFIREEFPKAIVETLLDARMEVENTLLKTQEHYIEWLVQSMGGNLMAFLNEHHDLEKTLSDKDDQGTQE
jgi:glutathionylspermidine synthase